VCWGGDGVWHVWGGVFLIRNNTVNLMHTSLSLHFIDVQCLDMFRALLARPQEALHGRRIGGYCVLKLIISPCRRFLFGVSDIVTLTHNNT
jgi:hypothetical protein